MILCRTTGENEVKLFITNPVTQSLLPIPIPDEYKQKSIISIDVLVVSNSEIEKDWVIDSGCTLCLSKE